MRTAGHHKHCYVSLTLSYYHLCKSNYYITFYYTLQATIPGITCGPLTAELVTQSHGRWFPVFILAAGVDFVGAIVYINQSAASQIL